MRRLFLIFIGTTFIISLQGAQQAARVANAAQERDVVAQANVAQAEMEHKEVAALRLSVKKLEGQLQRFNDEQHLTIPGFKIKTTPARLLCALLTFNCVTPIRKFYADSRDKLNALYEQEAQNEKGEGEEAEEGNPSVASNIPHIFAAAYVSKDGTQSIMRLGKKLKAIPLVAPKEVLVLISNQGALYLRLNPTTEQMMHGLSAERDQLLFDLCANLFGDNDQSEGYLQKCKRRILLSDFDDPQKENLCCNYFNQTVAEVERELQIAPQAIPAQVGAANNQGNNANNANVGANQRPAPRQRGFFQRAGQYADDHPVIATAAIVGAGVVIYYGAPVVAPLALRLII